jgi:hypothetical protein
VSKPSEKQSLSALRPDLAQQWHPTKNGGLGPRDVTPESDDRVWWLCEKGHWWQAPIRERVQGLRCTYCTGLGGEDEQRLAEAKPELLREWHPTRNPSLKARDAFSIHPDKVWWICSQGHEWEATIQTRLTGSGCPACGNVERTSALPKKPDQPHQAPSRNGRRPGAYSRLAGFHEATATPLSGGELRRGRRYERPAVVLIEKPPSGVLGYAEMQNFSAGGMMLLSEFFVRPGEIVRVKMDKPLHATVSTTMTGRVIWCHNLEAEEEPSSPFGIGLSLM